MSAEILIIDDNPDIRIILNELIQDAGYKTRLAANYNQALSEIDKKLPEVAIIDVKLDKGDNDGIELLNHNLYFFVQVDLVASQLRHLRLQFRDHCRLVYILRAAVRCTAPAPVAGWCLLVPFLQLEDAWVIHCSF